LVWTWKDDVSDIMLSRVTFNFTRKKILFFPVITMFTEYDFKDVQRRNQVILSVGLAEVVTSSFFAQHVLPAGLQFY